MVCFSVQQGEMQSPASVEEHLWASVHAGGYLAEKRLYRKEPSGHGRQQVEHHSAMCPCHKKD